MRDIIRNIAWPAYRIFSGSVNTAVSEFLIIALLGVIVMVVAAR